MTAAVFAFLDNAKEAMTEFVNNCLLVAGGFLVGYLLGGVIGWAMGKWIFRQQKPESLKRLGRPVGGTLLALIVAIIVFTGKGKPDGEGGNGKGSTNPDPNASKNPPKTDTDTKEPPSTTVPKVDLNPADTTLRVTILGGDDVVDQRFYLLDDDRKPKNFAELKEAILARKGKDKGKLMVAILIPTRNALPRAHLAITQLSKWANEEAHLDVIFPTMK